MMVKNFFTSPYQNFYDRVCNYDDNGISPPDGSTSINSTVNHPENLASSSNASLLPVPAECRRHRDRNDGAVLIRRTRNNKSCDSVDVDRVGLSDGCDDTMSVERCRDRSQSMSKLTGCAGRRTVICRPGRKGHLRETLQTTETETIPPDTAQHHHVTRKHNPMSPPASDQCTRLPEVPTTRRCLEPISRLSDDRGGADCSSDDPAGDPTKIVHRVQSSPLPKSILVLHRPHDCSRENIRFVVSDGDGAASSQFYHHHLHQDRRKCVHFAPLVRVLVRSYSSDHVLARLEMIKLPQLVNSGEPMSGFDQLPAVVEKYMVRSMVVLPSIALGHATTSDRC